MNTFKRIIETIVSTKQQQQQGEEEEEEEKQAEWSGTERGEKD